MKTKYYQLLHNKGENSKKLRINLTNLKETYLKVIGVTRTKLAVLVSKTKEKTT